MIACLVRTMVTQLIEHQRIRTTLPKAKELRRVADRMITYAKKVILYERLGFKRLENNLTLFICDGLGDALSSKKGTCSCANGRSFLQAL